MTLEDFATQLRIDYGTLKKTKRNIDLNSALGIEEELDNMKFHKRLHLALGIIWLVLGTIQLYLQWLRSSSEVNEFSLFLTLGWLLLGTVYLATTEGINKRIHLLFTLKSLNSRSDSKVELQNKILASYYKKNTKTVDQIVSDDVNTGRGVYIIVFFAVSSLINAAKYIFDAFSKNSGGHLATGLISFAGFVLLTYAWRVLVRKKSVIKLVQHLDEVDSNSQWSS